MDKYQQLAQMLTPIEEKDLILFNISPEEKSQLVRQYNRALINAQGDGTDVAQIFLKPLISQYPSWGDAALIFGLCLARENQLPRAEQSIEYAINNTLGSESNLTVAQTAIRSVREDMKNPDYKKEASGRGRSKSSMVSSGDSATARSGMQAPILMKASSRPAKIQMASDKERRDIMMRSASGGDEMPRDDINMENVRTTGENMRLAVKIIAGLVIVALLFVLIYFVIIPAALKLKSADDYEERNDYLVEKLNDNKSDPTVAAILADYAEKFDDVDAADVAAAAAASASESEAAEGGAEDTKPVADDASPSAASENGTSAPVTDAAETTPEDSDEASADVVAPVIGGGDGQDQTEPAATGDESTESINEDANAADEATAATEPPQNQ